MILTIFFFLWGKQECHSPSFQKMMLRLIVLYGDCISSLTVNGLTGGGTLAVMVPFDYAGVGLMLGEFPVGCIWLYYAHIKELRVLWQHTSKNYSTNFHDNIWNTYTHAIAHAIHTWHRQNRLTCVMCSYVSFECRSMGQNCTSHSTLDKSYKTRIFRTKPHPFPMPSTYQRQPNVNEQYNPCRKETCAGYP